MKEQNQKSVTVKKHFALELSRRHTIVDVSLLKSKRSGGQLIPFFYPKVDLPQHQM
jgi:hypothetical protein